MLSRCIVILVLVFIPRIAFSFRNEPQGFGKARLGMTVDEVKKIFPTMKQVGNPTPETAALLAVYTLDKQAVYGLKPCSVGLQFDPTRLYQISFDCGRDIKVVSTLQARFGDPTQAVPGSAFWLGDKTDISLNTKSKTFAFMEKSLSAAVQQHLMKYVLEHQPGHGAPQGVPTEQAGPTPPAAAQ